jgi:hypothetical protein
MTLPLPRSNDPIAEKALSIPCPNRECKARPGEPCGPIAPIHQKRYEKAARMLSDQDKLKEWEKTYGGNANEPT